MSDRDPIRDLENFSLEGDPVHPLPASEVRRRGDRMRRRRTGALAVGAAAAVAVIATSSVVAAQNLTGGGSPEPAPQPSPSATRTATPSAEWLTRVPDGFPLADGWPEPELEAGGEATTPTRGKVVGPNREILPMTLYVCGKEIATPTDPVDRLSAQLPQSFGRERQVGVFPDDSVAQEYVDSVRDAYQGCPRYETDPGDASLSRVIDLDRGDEAFQVHGNFENADEISENVEVVHVVRVGNAVLVERSSGFGPDVAPIAADHLADMAPPLAAMSVFAEAQSTPDSTPDSTPASGEFRTDIPKDFPIDTGLEDTDADSEIVGPSATARGVNDLELCGTSQLPTGYVGRLAVTYTAPEYGDSRELVTFADAEAAVRYLAALRTAVRDCPEDGLGRTLTELKADTGYDSITFALSSREGLGAEVYQVVRVGNGVLLTDEASHGTLDSARRDAPERTALADKLTPEMCIFTEAGC